MSDQPPEVVTPIDDYVIIKVLRTDELNDATRKRLIDISMERIMAQYHDNPPKVLMMLPSEWIVTSDPDEVEAFQPDHDCENCRAGNARARMHLINHPEDRLACGNLHYVEIW
jgi:hypothetical protein